MVLSRALSLGFYLLPFTFTIHFSAGTIKVLESEHPSSFFSCSVVGSSRSRVDADANEKFANLAGQSQGPLDHEETVVVEREERKVDRK
jgi:hypothetical protein